MKRISFAVVLFTGALLLFSFQLLQKRDEGDQKPKDSTISFPAFQLTIGNYVLSNTLLNDEQTALYFADTTEITFRKSANDSILFFAKKDTLHLYGEPGEYSGNKLMRLVPKNKSDNLKVTYWLEECISEQYDPAKFILRKGETAEDYEKNLTRWNKNKVSWSQVVKFREMKDSAGFFRIPVIGDDAVANIRSNPKLNLRDTLVDLSGESGNVATVVYKNKACYIGTCSAFMRIERYNGKKLLDTKYVFITDEDID